MASPRVVDESPLVGGAAQARVPVPPFPVLRVAVVEHSHCDAPRSADAPAAHRASVCSEWTHVQNRRQVYEASSCHLPYLCRDAASHNMAGTGIPRTYLVIEMPAQHESVEVREVCSGERQLDELQLNPAAVSAEETAGSRAPKPLALYFPQLLRH